MTRGLVLPLTPVQVVTRALYLAGEMTSDALDAHVRNPARECPVITYQLKTYNGGKDPTAPDPADRWLDGPGRRVTSDCMGGAAWCSGFDRYQSKRFAHIYEGWINTDSMILDAKWTAKCFRALARPEPGSLIVCKSGSPGHRIGHVGVVVFVPAEWDPQYLGCWKAIGVVDIAGRSGRANKRTTGAGWFGTGAMFLRSLMQP